MISSKALSGIHRKGIVLLAAVAVCFSVVSVQASGILIPKPPRDIPPEKVFRPLSIKSQHVDVSIENQAARTAIKQVFVNHTNRDLEGTYIFPIPENASITEFSMWMNGKKVEGELLEADKARRIYNDIVRRMRDPGLLEYAGQDMFRANVYPIPKHGEVKIEIIYDELLRYDAGLIGYHYPLNTERFSVGRLEEVSIAVKIRSKTPIKNLYSPTHEVDIENSGDSATCGYEEDDVRPDKDFILYYAVSEEDMGLNLLSHRHRGEDGYFMLLLSPGEVDDPNKIVEKDIVFVIDKSGSMKGEKIKQAKNALEYCLGNLNRRDRFNIIAFSTGVEMFEEDPVPFSRGRLSKALDFVDKIKARGGTNINEALQAALRFPRSRKPQMIVFLTDGLPTVGETGLGAILNNVKDKNNGNVRIFPFGLGYDVNTHLLDRLSEDNRGTVEYIRPEEDIEERVSTFYSKVSSPVLSNITLDFGDIMTKDVYPNCLPDIFEGTQLVVFGRYDGSGETPICLTGYVGEEKKIFEYTGKFRKHKRGNAFIPRLWATRKIAYLLSEIKLHGHNEELVDEVVALSKEHGIITPYTSYLVLEEDELAQHRRFTGRAPGEWGQIKAFEMPMVDITSGTKAVQRNDNLHVRGGRTGETKSSISGSSSSSGSASSQTGKEATRFSQNVARTKEQSVLDTSVSESVKYVGDKTFYRTKDEWIDKDFKEDMDVIEIKYLSGEYFDLMDKNPEIGKILSLGTKVAFIFKGKAYRIVE